MRLTLKRQRLGRRQLECRARYSWTVEWTAIQAEGIPTRADRGTQSASVAVDDDAVTSGQWRVAACVGIAD